MHRICPSSFATTFVLVAGSVVCVAGCESPTNPDLGQVESAAEDGCCVPSGGHTCPPVSLCPVWPPDVKNIGGPIVQHPKIVQVNYGGGVYIPEITASIFYPQSMPSFYLQYVSNG